MQSVNLFSDASCESPVSLVITATSSCVSSECSASLGASTYYVSTTCPSDAYSYAAETFGDTGYLLTDLYSGTSCGDTSYGQYVFRASGECELMSSDGQQGVIASLFSNGSAQLQYFLDSSCTYSVTDPYSISEDLLTSHTCYLGNKFYSNSEGSATNGVSSSASATSTGSTTTDASGGVSSSTTDGSGNGSSGVSIGLIAGIAGGCIVLLLLLGICCCCCWRRSRRKRQRQLQNITSSAMLDQPSAVTGYFQHVLLTPKQSTTTESSSRTSMLSKLWDDEAIVAARIPREKVVAEHLVNRGGFGEVYAGTYNGQRVAIKMLLPERKKSIQQVNAFLSEVKLMTTLDHPHIVTFIGVAWDSLTDLCVVTEYMIIDLKALLTKFQEQNIPTGFDHDKVKVALHVAHALTYLHSCAPPVIHRDLKSSNILLNETMDAKVTDFGISRERVDATMTAGVGTSLWMAPEVMLGERYDDKADMFSFGVVLSELDSHTLPYTFAKNSRSGDQISDAVVLQRVAMGQLSVQFSGAGLLSVMQLGLECVSLDPKQRPTAAEALYRLQRSLADTT